MNPTHIKPREIRVFLSSTFKDMEAERNYLIKQVFPKVRAACLARRVGFTEIDLRWGITEEESRNGATVEICLAEIDRCRDFPPFFIGFLGERYGWIPQAEELAAYWETNQDSPYNPSIRRAIERGISVTELEMELAVLRPRAAKKLHGHALFLLRDSSLTDSLYQQDTGSVPNPQDLRYYDTADGRLGKLKDRIRRTPFIGTDGYISIEQFGQSVEDYLLDQLNQYFPESEIPTPLQRMQEAHATFRFHRLQGFLPRPDVRKALLKAMGQRIEWPALGPILLTGPSGQGKSALMADLARHLETAKSKIHWRVIDHYIGADENNSLERWIQRILETLHPEIEDLTGPVPEAPKDQLNALATWLAFAARRNEQANGDGKPVRFALLLDALDQLPDGGRNLDPLTPAVLGADGILISSAADATPARESAAQFERVSVPPLTVALRANLIQNTLKRFRKGLLPGLAQRLANAPQAGSPLYLSLALEELRLDARHESLEALLDEILKSPDAADLFLKRFLLDQDYGRPELPTLAAPFMAMLGASQNGLTENELADLLVMPDDPKAADTGKPRLPQMHLSRLLTAFQPFLLNKQGNRAPMHRIFGEAALAYYGAVPVRKHLYAHFRKGYKAPFDARQAAEALYQVTLLARLDRKHRKQLEADLEYLPTPVGLYDVAPEVLREAFGEFSHEEKTALAARWESQIEPLVEADSEQLSTLLGLANWIKKQLGHYPAARTVEAQVLAVSRRIHGEEHLDTLEAMNNLAVTLNDLGDFSAARTMQEQVLEVRRRTLGDEHPDTLWAKGNFAYTLCALGNLLAARAMEEQVLEARRRILGDEHPFTLRAMNNLSGTLNALGDFPAARSMQEQMLVISRRILGDEHPDTLNAMGNIAHTLSYMGDLPAARAIDEQVLAARRRILGDEHPYTLTAMSNLAHTLNDLGDLLAARAMNEQVLAARRRVLGDEHPDTLITMGNLASTLGDLSDLPTAKAMEEQLLATRRRILGDEHPDTLTAMGNLACTLRALGDLPTAKAMEEQLLATRRRILGDEHPDTLLAMGNFACTLRALGDLPTAKAMEEQLLATHQRLLGDEHPHTLTTMGNLAGTLSDLGNLSAARLLYEQILATREKLNEATSPEVAEALFSLGSILGQMGEFDNAEKLLRRELGLWSSRLGENERMVIYKMANLGKLLEVAGNIDGMTEIRKRQIVALEQTVGIDHKETIRVLQNLAVALRNAGRLEEAESLQREALKRFIRARGKDSLEAASSYSAMGALLKLKGDIAEARTCFRKALAIRERELGPDADATQLVRNRLAELDQ